jgi:formate dehydrogenase iron-sulfur subunit
MIHEPLKSRLITPGTVTLLVIMGAGAVAVIYRYVMGLGAATNLSDQYPWGLWVAVDVFSGVALAAGSFTVAALVFIFGGVKYQILIRAAVLTGLLGYVFVAIALAVDLGQPLHIWHPIIMWPEHSVMFEVAWCVMLYMTVLALEFAPTVFERFEWTELQTVWRKFMPVFSAVALAFFVGIMSLSWIWAIVALIFFGALAVIFDKFIPTQPEVPVLLIIAGVTFSTMHQSSLGAVLLLMPDKLDGLWWTPVLPINFFLSAVAVGFAIVIFEATLSSKAFKRSGEWELLTGMGRFLAIALWIYLLFRVTDMVLRGQFPGIFESDKANLFLMEMIVGVVIPACILTNTRLRQNTGILFTAATLVVVGVVFNRINVVWLAMTMPVGATYFPSLLEILITVSVIAAIVFFFVLAVKLLPVFPSESGEGAGAVPDSRRGSENGVVSGREQARVGGK